MGLKDIAHPVGTVSGDTHLQDVPLSDDGWFALVMALSSDQLTEALRHATDEQKKEVIALIDRNLQYNQNLTEGSYKRESLISKRAELIKEIEF